MGLVLVTGASGMIGRRVALAAQAAGRRVVGLDRRALPNPGFPFIEGDVLDTHRLYAAIAGERLDAVIHCGALSGLMVARDNPHLICTINVQGTVNVLELARAAGARRIVLCSTVMVYGSAEGEMLTEESVPHPTTVYGASKVACETLMRAYAEERGLDGVALRIAHVYGPGRETQCFIRDSLRDGFSGRSTRLPHAASSERQYVHVDDVVAAILLAATRERLPRRIYNVSAGEKHRLDEAMRIVGDVVGGAEVSFDTADPPEYRAPLLDIAAARAELGYAPQYDLRHGVAAYAAHLREHPV
jgi:nucleoside-diphosphate-sugar epimerase